jgi:hypothetical protein
MSGSAIALFGLMSATIRKAPGMSSCRRPSRFPPSSTLIVLSPVTLPPGRLKLATRPSCTGSPLVTKTIGIVVVARLAARTAAVPNGATICLYLVVCTFGKTRQVEQALPVARYKRRNVDQCSNALRIASSCLRSNDTAHTGAGNNGGLNACGQHVSEAGST